MRIAYFCDGTWNDPASNTNVYKLSNATLHIPGEQDARYDPGVGTDGSPLDKLTGGALGAGLVNKVKDGYTRIAHMYHAGDELFLFGFSRGAYTARCLAGMIAICGLPTQNVDQQCVDTAWQAYRDQDHRATLLGSLGSYAMENAQIKMLGVWDTVGALGIPAMWGGIDSVQYGFLSTDLHANVLNAYQALAIDERRAQFPPTLWTAACGEGQVLEQVWFSGVHCDVGGGYPTSPEDNGTSLSDITLGWMASKAQALGLKLDAGVAAKYQPLEARYAMDQIHESWRGLFMVTPPHARTIGAGALVSNSVTIRCDRGLGYAPGNLSELLSAKSFVSMSTVSELPVAAGPVRAAG
jgi:uncharacterized protein (DUF2235 family)